MKLSALLLLLLSTSVGADDVFFSSKAGVSDFELNTRCWAYAQIAGKDKRIIDQFKTKANKLPHSPYEEGLNVGYASGFIKSGSMLLEISKKQAANMVFNSTCR